MNVDVESLLRENLELKESLEVERANRIHLKDDTRKAKHKAYNMFNDVIIPELELAIQAIDRESPKKEISIHKMNLILSLIKTNLNEFK